LVDVLMQCYSRIDSAAFPGVLERLRSNVHDPLWQRKLTYFAAVSTYLFRRESDLARIELAKLEPMSDETDVETLQLYLDLFGRTLSFSAQLDVIDRILRFSQVEVDQLHYRILKALRYIEIGDSKKGENELDAAVARFRKSSKSADSNAYALDMFGSALELLGGFSQSTELLDESLELFHQALTLDTWNERGRAKVWGQIADALRRKAEWASALEAYATARKFDDQPIFRVFVSECYLQLDQVTEAVSQVDSIESALLDEAELTDYVFAFAAIAVAKGERERLQQAIALLKQQDLASPLFRSRRDELQVSAMEALRRGTSRPLIDRVRTLLANILSRANRYLLVEPNVMGFGIRGNAILTDLAKAVETHQTAGHDGPKSKT
jgi:tetratricopeptide (TPR) repeat protein